MADGRGGAHLPGPGEVEGGAPGLETPAPPLQKRGGPQRGKRRGRGGGGVGREGKGGANGGGLGPGGGPKNFPKNPQKIF